MNRIFMSVFIREPGRGSVGVRVSIGLRFGRRACAGSQPILLCASAGTRASLRGGGVRVRVRVRVRVN